MKTEISSLESLIAERAEKRLVQEIADFMLLVREHKLFKAIEETNVRLPEGKNETLRYFFWGSDYPAGKAIKEHFLPEYILAESTDFMEKVDNLQSQINELKNPEY